MTDTQALIGVLAALALVPVVIACAALTRRSRCTVIGSSMSATVDTEREEQVVCEETARRLIPLTALTDALRWTRDLHQLAIELHCTVDVVSTRLATMHHPAERAAVRRVLDDVERP